MSQSATEGHVKVAVMGATGTGKSAFIHHLTNDSQIRIGEGIGSKTSEIQTSYYPDARTGRPVMLIDTPGFDDSREGITDTDILQRIIDFLEPGEGEGKKLNGIIYLHRISDPRMGGIAKKNLRMFQALCGEKSLHNVRIITTYWDCDGGKGVMREEELKRAFEPLLVSGAQMRRHFDNAASARAIMEELIPLPQITTQVQEEVAENIPLGETSAGHIINEEIEAMKKKHESELANLGSALEQSARVRNEEMRAELEDERRDLEEKLMRVEEDQRRLTMTVQQVRVQQREAEEAMKEFQSMLAARTAQLTDMQSTESGGIGMMSRKELEEELTELKDRYEKAEHYAKLGVIGRFLDDWAGVISFCERKGRKKSRLGGLGGVIAGTIIGPVVAATRIVFGR